MSNQNKNPKEASNIFHSIMKASVTPKKLTDAEIINAVQSRFEKKIERIGSEFRLVDDNLNPQFSLVKEINKNIEHISKHGI
jgi:hypothetical protein